MVLKKLDRRVIRTRRAIKDALLLLLNEKEMAFITITDIVNYSDLNRSTFYAHFQDKEDLLDCLIDDLINGLLDVFQNRTITFEYEESYPYQHPIIEMFKYVSEHAYEFNVLLHTTKVPRFTPELYVRLYKFALLNIKKLPDKEALMNIHIGLYANYLSSTFISFVHYWIVDREQKYSPEYISNEFIKVVLSNPLAAYIKGDNSES